MDRFKNEARSPLHHPSQYRDSEKHYGRAETQSLTVEIKVKVENETRDRRGEGKAGASSATKKNESSFQLDGPRSTERSTDREFASRNQTNDTICYDDDNRQSVDVVSTLREKYPAVKAENSKRSKSKYKRSRYDEKSRSRSKSYSRNRRFGTPERGRRSYSRYRRESRSRSRSRCRRRRYDTPDRSRRTLDRDVRRSRSRSKCRRDGTYRSRRNYFSDRNMNKSSRNSSREDQLDRLRYDSRDVKFEGKQETSFTRNDNSNDPLGVYDGDHVSVADPKTEVREMFSNNSTLGMLRSRIQSTLMNSAGKWKEELAVSIAHQSGNVCQSSDDVYSKYTLNQSMLRKQKYDSSTVTSGDLDQMMQSNWQEENRAKISMNQDVANKNCAEESNVRLSVDESIIEKIVSSEPSGASTYSHSNVDVAPKNNQMDFNTVVDPRIKKMLGLQLQAERTTNINKKTQLSRINESHHPVQWRRMSQITPIYNDSHFSVTNLAANPPNRFDNHSFGSQKTHSQSGNIRRVPKTYGEYRRLQSLNDTSPTNNDNKATTAMKSESKMIAKSNEVRKEVTKKKTASHQKRILNKNNSTQEKSINNESTAVKSKSISKMIAQPMEKVRKEATKEKEKKPNKRNSTPEEMHTQSTLRESQDSVNSATENEESIPLSFENQISNTNAMNTLKELMNPQNLLTLVNLMEQMTENNSLAKVKEALQTCTNEADVIANEKHTHEISNSNDLVLAHKPTKPKKKNELDRLHEDIDNMFIRNDVLNATGRQRNIAKTDSELSIDDVAIGRTTPKIQSKRRIPSVNHVSTHINNIPLKPLGALQTSQISQTADNVRKVVKKKGSSKATEDISWVPKKRVKPSVLPAKKATDDADWLPTKRDKLKVKPSILSVKSASPVTTNPRIKNNNLDMHSLIKFVPCQICDQPPGVSLISHYVNYHRDSEVLTSRLSPEAAKCLRESTEIKECEAIRSESGVMSYKQFCYFCNSYSSYPKSQWIDHIIRHTGYFHYRCNDCTRKFTSPARYHTCGERYNVERVNQPIFQQEHITAYVCELCNYVRFYEAEMEKHLNNEHGDGDAKEFKVFTFLTLPKGKIGRPLGKRNHIRTEFESEIESESEFEEDEYKLKVQTEKNCNENSMGSDGGCDFIYFYF